MILGICRHDECVCNIINTQDFQSPIEYFFFLFAIIQQQKLIDRLNKTPEDVEITTTTSTSKRVFYTKVRSAGFEPAIPLLYLDKHNPQE